MNYTQWNSFKSGAWREEINVKDFINKNLSSYLGDNGFLAKPSNKTKELWKRVEILLAEEISKGVSSIDTDTIAGVNAFRPGYIDKENEIIVGLQADAPLKRVVNPYGGVRMTASAAETYGYKVNEKIMDIFTNYRKTHNQGVFDAYTDEMKLARKVGIITGLPDAYGRGRIIGDYRRIALYGTEILIIEKQKELKSLVGKMDAKKIQLREDISEQIKALKEINEMAKSYGVTMDNPAKDAREAAQFVYFGYLAGVKQQNGAAMSLGRVSTFLDIYIERDLKIGMITENEAQEIIDQLIIKLRLVRHLRTPEYNDVFAGDPTWVTESIGGMTEDGRTLVTRTSFRFLHSLTNLGPAPEPNMTVLWSKDLPEPFKKFCAELSILTDSIQYESDDMMRAIYGDDYAIACCVSAMQVGKQMQFFGARSNLAKALLYAINGGVDEILEKQVGPKVKLGLSDILLYSEVKEAYEITLDWLAELYVNTMNVIHYMHDKYAYESAQMALHDASVERLMAFGIAGLSVAVDSLSAIRYAEVTPIRNEKGLAIDFKIKGEYPKYGNDDDRVDKIAIELVEYFMNALRKHETYRDAKHTLSILTITSNVMYGKKTGNTPDGRVKGTPLAPGANPMHGRDINGALASLNSVAKIPYCNCQDGVSNTFSIIPSALGKDDSQRTDNLVAILDGYFDQNAHHLNVNVLDREKLIDAMENPGKYPNLTIRVSGYAVNFNKLSKQHQEEVIKRTFHTGV